MDKNNGRMKAVKVLIGLLKLVSTGTSSILMLGRAVFLSYGFYTTVTDTCGKFQYEITETMQQGRVMGECTYLLQAYSAIE